MEPSGFGAGRANGQEKMGGGVVVAVSFGSVGLTELLVILLIVVIIFGAGKLPQLGRGLGEGIKNFKSSLKNAGDEDSTKNDS